MNILVFQHLAVEHPGIFRDFWHEAGHSVHIVALDEGAPIPDLAGFDLLAVMGGPMDVWETDKHPWLVPELDAIRTWVCDLGRPYLGICLGHQLLAEAVGGKVGRMAAPEVGVTATTLTQAGRSDPLFAGFPEEIQAFQWHGAEVQQLPQDGVTLAGNAACPVQAIRVGERAWGIQFHVEMTSSTVAEWGAVPEYAASMQTALGAERAKGLEAELASDLPAFNAMARRINDNLFRAIAKVTVA
ncbi:type 1 glutamine amidotransferase [Paracoccus laeviglucosivorans]|uniref:GMP synthase-Glutamine amidotransferase n=1 Tax=Paracoccus laeviglucosivorans TaxID=1197861 RepID=A0A521AZX0_9RHOB|nr:type 1 glutamine amidotransferase [Paracoccus laeviglucosivorans]SMO40321.1 GMP synthase-Glutamine amidotransferase [Paracoccus laeviglucosivorans]